MKSLAFLIVLMLSLEASSQSTINVDDSSKFTNSIMYFNSGSGIPYVMSKYARIVEGSIFIPEKLSPAYIFLRGNQKAISPISARLNIIENTLNYFDEIKGIELSAIVAISEARFKDSITGQTRIYTQSIPGCTVARPGWHEVMETGKLNLYRQINKTIIETKQYGSATAEQKVETSYSYFIKSESACKSVKKIAELTDLLIQSDPGFKDKIPKRKLSDKKEEDWIEIAKLYNQ
jgi:hypothetical protein